MNATLSKCKIERSLFVEARQWIDKTYGNTYFSARVFVDGELVATLPFQYGYGEQYLSETKRELVKLGYLPERYENKPLWHARDDFGFDFYHSTSYTNKSEMFKAVK